MAKVVYADLIEGVRGAVTKKGVIYRKKHYAIDEHGHYVEGKAEVYQRVNERDYTKNPVTAAERAHQTRFGQVCKQADAELQDPERRAYWQARFEKQIQKPEVGNAKCYVQLRGFVKAMIMKEG